MPKKPLPPKVLTPMRFAIGDEVVETHDPSGKVFVVFGAVCADYDRSQFSANLYFIVAKGGRMQRRNLEENLMSVAEWQLTRSTNAVT